MYHLGDGQWARGRPQFHGDPIATVTILMSLGAKGRSRILPEKLPVAQIVKKFPTLYGS
jgi:hypothetical protein